MPTNKIVAFFDANLPMKFTASLNNGSVFYYQLARVIHILSDFPKTCYTRRQEVRISGG